MYCTCVLPVAHTIKRDAEHWLPSSQTRTPDRTIRRRRSISPRTYARYSLAEADENRLSNNIFLPQEVMALAEESSAMPYYLSNRIPLNFLARGSVAKSRLLRRDEIDVPQKRQSAISAPSRDWCRMLGYTVCPRSSGR